MRQNKIQFKLDLFGILRWPRPNRCVTKNWWQYVDVRRWWRRWWYWDHLDVRGILICSKQNNKEIYLFFSAEEFEHWYSRSCCHRDREQQNTNWTQIHHFGFLCVFLYKYLSSDWIISVCFSRLSFRFTRTLSFHLRLSLRLASLRLPAKSLNLD